MDDLESYLYVETPTFVLQLSSIFVILASVVVVLLKINSMWTRKSIICILFIEYLFLVFCETLIFRPVAGHREIRLKPFWSYQLAFNSYPSLIMLWEVLLNIFLFIPIGLLLGMIFPQLKWWKIFLFGSVLSAVIEMSQYFFCKGLCETDDVINNSLGTLIGFFLCKIMLLMMGRFSLSK